MSGQQRAFDTIQQFKKEVEEMASDEKMLEYRGKAYGDKFAEEWLRLVGEHFTIEEIYGDDELATLFQEKLEEGGEFSNLAYDHIKEQLYDGDITLDDLINLDDEDQKAQLVAFIQGNFYVEEVFPRERDIDGTINEERWSKPQFKPYSETNPEDSISVSISGEVSRQVETLEAQNARLVAENQRLQQQLQAIKSLLHAN
jgi:FtsZ-binding cell division protein ZapB